MGASASAQPDHSSISPPPATQSSPLPISNGRSHSRSRSSSRLSSSAHPSPAFEELQKVRSERVASQKLKKEKRPSRGKQHDRRGGRKHKDQGLKEAKSVPNVRK
ncbi:hypothetical protein TrRE_jg2843, partial [Triparma retinervis]